MTLLTPIWLLSIAAIGIPLLIHLWNITPGKTLKVGSISLIAISSRKQSRSFKLLDVLLLLLRCLFLVLLSFVLAAPYFTGLPGSNKEKGWLLIPKEDIKEAYQKFKPKVDSLLQSGYELHYFNTGFKKITIEQALKDTVNQSGGEPYWYLLQQLEHQTGSALPIYLITPNWLNKFKGDRPGLALKLNWQTYTPVDSIFTTIKKAWFTPDKNVRVIVTTSTPLQTYQHAENIEHALVKNSAYNIDFKEGSAFINLKADEKHALKIDTALLNIDIYADAGTTDVDYVKAALQSIGQFSRQNIVIKNYGKFVEFATKHDWLFWLSEKPLDDKVLTGYKNIFVYEKGKKTASNTWVNYREDNLIQSSGQNISVFKSVSHNNLQGEQIWQDGYGSPLLTMNIKGDTHLYHFYNKFNPAYSDLVWNGAFPQLMQKLISPEQPASRAVDRRRIDASQMTPGTIKQVNSEHINNEEHSDVTRYFWLLLVVVFVLERWLAHRKANGGVVA